MVDKPTPTALLKLSKGKLYGKQRDRADNEPQPITSIEPRCPIGFNKDQKREWRYFKQILKNYGLFTLANAPILEMLSCSMVEYRECLAKSGQIIVKGKSKIIIRKDGTTVEEGGFPYYNPFWTAKNKLQEQILKCLGELGLSSTGLARLGSLVANKKANSKMEKLLD